MVDESKSVVEAIDRIRGALAPDKSEQSSDSLIQALDRIYEVLKPGRPQFTGQRSIAMPIGTLNIEPNLTPTS